ncbi:bifunctional metallophosphatase/5'-nucleotidase [Rathayibacter soli]|uniref:bifunctional metallophosphatase/5'-nucleotidase n=1 Tax=Rathayibacter soli TaxID=3144168 RepID=UPI0027E546B5|nr:bifunctional UDP-sugar hydrolase/5'-nucleotidase [Glaciibacter superstes]
MATPRRMLGKLTAASILSFGLIAAPIVAAPAIAADPAPAAPAATVPINLIGINDFHGRIDSNTVKFAGTVEQVRAEYGDANSLFVSAGDNYGASVFASASAQDVPTIDVLNALGLQASAVGNHEFDQGFADLTGRVMGLTGSAKGLADWEYLGANVTYTSGGAPALPKYKTFTVDGVTVGVIGAVTQETPSLVAPAGIAGLTFGDPVTAINEVADQLTDGDSSNGEADVIIASYHEGAAAGDAAGGTLDDQVAAGGAFAEIVNDTSPKVSAIFTGHTHQAYAWDAPWPGHTGQTRPIIQTGSYGANVGQIVLQYDPNTKSVASHTMRNVPRVTTADDTLAEQYPRVKQVQTIVYNALAAADVIGKQPVGSVAADITTAFTGGSYVNGVYTAGTFDNNGLPVGRDDRAKESTLGNLIADSLVATLGSADRGGAEIGVVNPGGIRSELYQAPDGVITYAEANAVLPFLNNLWTTTLTGAQFKTVLEQQWQTSPDGTPITSRPFLNLGLSNNVSYTYDADAAQGEHITSISVNGAPIDPTASYRIGSFSFLLEGGDNFREFANGTDTKDSGLIDRDGWIAYLGEHADLSPSFARRGVQVTGVPASADRLSPVSFDVKNLDLTSLGSPENTTLDIAIDGVPGGLGSVPVTPGDPGNTQMANGTATVSFTVPDAAPDASVVVLTAQPSGTVVRVPLTVTTAPPPATSPTSADESAQTPQTEGGITTDKSTYHPGDTVRITVGAAHVGEYVSTWLWSTPTNLGGWQQVRADGTIAVTLPKDVALGAHRLVVQGVEGNVIGWAAITVAAVPSGGSDGQAGGTAAGSGNGSGLANTGSDLSASVLGAGLLLLLGAGALLTRRRMAASEGRSQKRS